MAGALGHVHARPERQTADAVTATNSRMGFADRYAWKCHAHEVLAAPLGIPTTLVCAASIWLVMCVLVIAPREAAAQQFTTRHDRQIEGLGNLSVTCLLQDRAGFIWMCTENGLFRHDGVGFERFWKSEGIDSSTIRGAVEDASGALWVGTSQDLYRRDEHGFRAIRPEGRSLRLAAGLRIAALASGRLLVIDADQLLELSAAAPDGIWHSRPLFAQEQLGAIPALEHLSSVYVDRRGRIWLG
jgi:ligand-binding sensor domain-containing protein